MTLPEITQILTAATAVLAVIVGPIITLLVARRQSETALSVGVKQSDTSKNIAELQARSNVLSKSRQEWINTLRNEISEFLASVIHPSNLVEVGETKDSAEQKISAMRNVLLHLSKVRLLINHKEEDHSSLVAKMAEMYKGLNDPAFDFSKAESELTLIAQAVLKREWERVKSFT